MEDVGARLRAEVEALVAQMGRDVNSDYAALMERYNAMTDEERAAAVERVRSYAVEPIDLEKCDFGYFNAATGAGNAIIDGEAYDRD